MLTLNVARASLALLVVGTAWGCSKAPSPANGKSENTHASTTVGREEEPPGRKPIAAPTPINVEKRAEEVSRILGKANVMERGKPSCKIDFVYVGYDPEDLLQDAPCEAVTAKMMDQAELERLGRWGQLKDFERRHVNQLPGGKVLYVEEKVGDENAKASIYPVGTTRLSYEVSFAD